MTVERVGIKRSSELKWASESKSRIRSRAEQPGRDSGKCRLREQLVGARDIGLDVLIHVSLHHLVGCDDCTLDGPPVGGTVSLENIAIEAEERRAAVALGVDSFLQRIERAL